MFVKVVDQLVKGESLQKIYAFYHHLEHKGQIYKAIPSTVAVQFRCIATRHRLPGGMFFTSKLTVYN